MSDIAQSHVAIHLGISASGNVEVQALGIAPLYVDRQCILCGPQSQQVGKCLQGCHPFLVPSELACLGYRRAADRLRDDFIRFLFSVPF